MTPLLPRFGRLRAASWAFAGLFVAATAASAEGLAKVSFVHPETFVDARDSAGRFEDNLKVLAQHLQRLAKRQLADGQVLQVEVLDVDLAGRVWPGRMGTELRVIRENHDWPRIKLRYVLEAGGVVQQRGEDTLTDMNFASHMFGALASEPLPYEKRMLNVWFAARFVSPAAAADH